MDRDLGNPILRQGIWLSARVTSPYEGERRESELVQTRDSRLEIVGLPSMHSLECSAEYPALIETLGGVLESALIGASIILLWDFNPYVGNYGDTWRCWIGRNGPPDLNPSGFLLFDFCGSHSLSTPHTVCGAGLAVQWLSFTK